MVHCRVLLAAGKIHHLANLGLGDFMAEHANHCQALFVDNQHDLKRLGMGQAKETL